MRSVSVTDVSYTFEPGLTRQDPARLRALPGAPYPLGVLPDAGGVNIAVLAPGADAVEFCLLDSDSSSGGSGPGRGETRYRLPERCGGVWHGYIPGVRPGQRYGLRAHGPYDPARGLRYNPAKLLLDPYARRVEGTLTPGPAIFGYADGDPYSYTADGQDSAPFVPVGVVTALPSAAAGRAPVPGRRGGGPAAADPAGNRPGTPWRDTVIYELHVRGFTRLHPALPPALRGTYAGLAHPAVLDHLTGLGITAVELLPVHAHVSEPILAERGLTNFWGYNTIGFFAPHPGYAATDDPVTEFRAMVAALHEAGIEVLLDVVYNHTAEQDERGPTLSMRGLDNTVYYRLEPTDPRRYRDVTGCGNTLNVTSPHVVRLVCDSLRYWLTEMGVDGFRFDLAAALARNPDGFDPDAPLLTAIGQDPVLAQAKLIAEPWDVGWGGYQVGAFPAPWAEWNDRFRATVRETWSGRATSAADLGYRITASSDLFEHGGRPPCSSVNFVTAHDGFTLADLVSYEHKHNEANLEDNRDGDNNNRSRNHGAEGPTDDPVVLERRRRVRRGMLATLLLSAGVPMLVAGDEFGRSQGGNNNAYCQDNPVSWLAWPTTRADGRSVRSGGGWWPRRSERVTGTDVTGTDDGNGEADGADSRRDHRSDGAAPRSDGTGPLPPKTPEVPAPDPAGEDQGLSELASCLLTLRRASPALCRGQFFHGGQSSETHRADMTWFLADGTQMSDADWNAPNPATVVAFIAGDSLTWLGPDGTPATGDSLLLVLHPGEEDVDVHLPGAPWASRYDLVLDTAATDLSGLRAAVEDPRKPLATYPAGETLRASWSSVVVLRAHR
ncbi:glycogen debranching protein GlgX [Pseudofrankia sp. BMG5.37]|uniref:glycogen debranching protein GlgX n=1 Tax=Pseudofrankia sp. BMG5.37 TaxID=3050035 RepID=UPI000B1341B7|nr:MULTISPECIES: glycogen debranching protein GlgX [unclassified Pseudofrankia]MDT3445865.1 glycogen debranching protein GlgX [Pseudofrankia sp. BMG5.37]